LISSFGSSGSTFASVLTSTFGGSSTLAALPPLPVGGGGGGSFSTVFGPSGGLLSPGGGALAAFAAFSLFLPTKMPTPTPSAIVANPAASHIHLRLRDAGMRVPVSPDASDDVV
jgi:hypothetical protein